MTAVRETAAPWIRRQAEFDGIAIVFQANHEDAGLVYRVGHGENIEDFSKYGVAWGFLPWNECKVCRVPHMLSRGGGWAYDGDSLEEAEAAYAALERKLLSGELA